MRLIGPVGEMKRLPTRTPVLPFAASQKKISRKNHLFSTANSATKNNLIIIINKKSKERIARRLRLNQCRRPTAHHTSAKSDATLECPIGHSVELEEGKRCVMIMVACFTHGTSGKRRRHLPMTHHSRDEGIIQCEANTLKMEVAQDPSPIRGTMLRTLSPLCYCYQRPETRGVY